MEIFTILIIIVVIFFVYSFIVKPKVNDLKEKFNSIFYLNDVYNFSNPNAAKKYTELYNILGEPHTKVDSPGGFVIWRNPNSNEIILRDEAFEHLYPESHCDNIYMTLCRVYLPDFGLRVVPRLMPYVNIWYDSVKHELTTRCESIDHCVCILWIAMKMHFDPENVDKILAELGNALRECRGENGQLMRKALFEMVRANRVLYKKEIGSGKSCKTLQGQP